MSTTSMALPPNYRHARLTDDILRELLTPLLRVPDDDFRDNSSNVSPFAAPSEFPCASLLTVCKQWMRVSTSLLYEVVILRSTPQAIAFERALKANPEFGRLIKKLRIEGGFGKAVEKIIKASPNVQELCLSMVLWGHDNVKSLVNSLHLINPTHVTLIDLHSEGTHHTLRDYPNNTSTKELTQKLCSCIETEWTNMVHFNFPYGISNDYRGRGAIIARALSRSSSVRTISVPFYFDVENHLIPMSSKKNQLRKIHVKARQLDPAFIGLARLQAIAFGGPFGTHDPTLLIQGHPRLLRIVKFPPDPLIQQVQVQDQFQDHRLPIGNPLYIPMSNASSDDKERIWSRIIMFASESTHDQPPYFNSQIPLIVGSPIPPLAGKKPSRLNSQRLCIAMVSRLFFRLSEPYLYRDPDMKTATELEDFAQLLDRRPNVAKYIYSLTFRPFCLGIVLHQLMALDPYAEIATADRSLRSIFRAATNLRLFQQPVDIPPHGNWSLYQWSWDIIDCLNSKSIISLPDIRLQAPASKAALGSILRFERLKELHINCCQSHTQQAPASNTWGLLASSSLPNLEKLGIEEHPSYHFNDSPRSYRPWYRDLLKIITTMDLPSIHSFTVANTDMFLDFSRGTETDDLPPEIVPFLTKHGSKLSNLQIFSTFEKNYSPLNHCTNLETLTVVIQYCIPNANLFRCEHPCPALKKITMSGGTYGNRPSLGASCQWQEFFDETDFGAFPALEELHIPGMCQWPTNEREIRRGKNPWILRAEQLKNKFGVRLTDENGKSWVPRLSLK